MEVLVHQGKVIYIGSSNFAGWHIASAQAYAASRNFIGLISEQSLYNLKDRMIELEVIPACRHYGLGLIPYSPLAGGLLGGVLQKVKEGRRASENMQKNIDKYHNSIERYETFCNEKGERPADIALAWLLHNPVVTAPIVGPRTIDQLDGCLHAFDITFSDEDLVKLDSIWPGPGGEAPEAYAW
jgi:aryl-alcohol dehydrogenase-like predicted oxidoreductase